MSSFFDKTKSQTSGTAQFQSPPSAKPDASAPRDMKANIRRVTPLFNAIESCIMKGDMEGAEAHCKELEAFLIEFAGQGAHPDAMRFLSVVYSDLGSAYRRMRYVAQAERFYTQAIDLLHTIAGLENDAQYAGNQLAACKNQLGLLYMDCGPRDKAVFFLEDAIAMRRLLMDKYPQDHLNAIYLGGAFCNLAHLAADRADIKAAAQLYDQAIAIFDQMLPKSDRDYLEATGAAMSAAMKQPHWILIGLQFRDNAENGKRKLPAL